jgi:hypothetical protein
MPQYTVHHVVDPNTSGYIKQEKLEQFLLDRFKGSELKDFAIKVRLASDTCNSC